MFWGDKKRCHQQTGWEAFRSDAFENAGIPVFHPGILSSFSCTCCCCAVCLSVFLSVQCLHVSRCVSVPVSVCTHCLHACCLHSMEWGVCHRGKPSQSKTRQPSEKNWIPSNLQISLADIYLSLFFFPVAAQLFHTPPTVLKRDTSRQKPS